MKPTAVIDIGTNSVKLLVASVTPRRFSAGGPTDQIGEIKPFLEKVVITRLGRGLVKTGNLSEIAMKGTIKVLDTFCQISRVKEVDHIYLLATAAVRRARNKKVFLETVRKRLGLQVKVLSAQEEALFSYLGTLSMLDKIPPRLQSSRQNGNFMVIDIGGGSTELTWGNHQRPLGYQLLELGAVGLTEQLVRSDPIRDEEYRKMHEYIIQQCRHDLLRLRTSSFLSRSRHKVLGQLIGVGGTMVTLAAMDMGVKKLSQRVDGHLMTLHRLEFILQSLKKASLAERKKMPGLEPPRADIILAGTLILVTAMKFLGFNRIITTTRGLRHGYLLRQYILTLPK